MHNPSRQATSIQPGDYVAWTDPHNVVYWGTAASTVLNDGPWPQRLVDFTHEQGEPRLVPERDITAARRNVARTRSRHGYARGGTA